MRSDRLLSLLSVGTGVIGLGLAFYFYRRSVEERIPTYYVDPVRTSIVASTGAKPSELEVLYNGTPLKEGDVTAVRVYFWNDGRMPIRNTDILRPLSLVVNPSARILDARVLKSSRQVTNIAVGLQSSMGGVPLLFDVLEENDGAAIQIIYAGSPSADIAITGVVVGAHEVRRKLPPQSLFSIRILGITLIITGLCKAVLGFIAKKKPSCAARRSYVGPLYFSSPAHQCLRFAPVCSM